MFMKVDFPEPDGPMTATNSPGRTSKETPRKARTRVCPNIYVFARLRTAITGAGKSASSVDVVEATCGEIACVSGAVSSCRRDCRLLIECRRP